VLHPSEQPGVWGAPTSPYWRLPPTPTLTSLACECKQALFEACSFTPSILILDNYLTLAPRSTIEDRDLERSCLAPTHAPLIHNPLSRPYSRMARMKRRASRARSIRCTSRAAATSRSTLYKKGGDELVGLCTILLLPILYMVLHRHKGGRGVLFTAQLSCNSIAIV